MNQGIVKRADFGLEKSYIDSKAMETLLPTEKKIIEAGLSVKIDQQEPVDVVTTMISIVTSAYTRAGYKMPDSTTLALYADEFYQILIEKYPKVTLPEIQEAVKNGVYGEAGEFTGLNPKTFLQFVKHYLFAEARKTATVLFEEKKLRLSNQWVMDVEEAEADNADFINYLYGLFLAGSLVSDYIPVFVFDFLEKKKEIILTKDAKFKIKDRATSYLARLKSSNKFKGAAKSVPDELTNFIQTRDETITIKNISRQFAVWDFFDLKRSQGKTIIFSVPKQISNV